MHINFEKSHPTVGEAHGAVAVQEERTFFMVGREPHCHDVGGGGLPNGAGAAEREGPHQLSHGLTCPGKAPGFPVPESQICLSAQ